MHRHMVLVPVSKETAPVQWGRWDETSAAQSAAQYLLGLGFGLGLGAFGVSGCRAMRLVHGQHHRHTHEYIKEAW